LSRKMVEMKIKVPFTEKKEKIKKKKENIKK
jgi:hypothetical protein